MAHDVLFCSFLGDLSRLQLPRFWHAFLLKSHLEPICPRNLCAKSRSQIGRASREHLSLCLSRSISLGWWLFRVQGEEIWSPGILRRICGESQHDGWPFRLRARIRNWAPGKMTPNDAREGSWLATSAGVFWPEESSVKMMSRLLLLVFFCTPMDVRYSKYTPPQHIDVVI